MSSVFPLFDELMQRVAPNRLLRLTFPHNDGPACRFLVDKLDAIESLSRDFVFTVDLLADKANLALKEMQGKLLCIELVRKDGSLRYFTGYVFSFRCEHSDGGLTRYQAVLGPWLKFLSLRQDNYLFHGKTLREQAEIIFSDYGTCPAWQWKVIGEDPPMTDACQFDESDHNYLSRRWETAGWYYWYEHTAQGHTLIIADDTRQQPAIDGDSDVRFHSEGGSEEEDAIDHWSPVRHIVASSVALKSHNFKSSAPADVSVPTLNQQGSVPAIESYEYTGAYGYKGYKDGDATGKLRMEEIEAAGKQIEAEGNHRAMLPGRCFKMTDHFSYDLFSRSDKANNADRDGFLVVSVHHIVHNNHSQQKSNDPQRNDENASSYRNKLICIRKDIPWRPGRGYNSTQTKILAPQTATVVGPNGQGSIYTDEYGRVRVQFHWDREGQRDERSSAWLRVATPWAGAELGAASIPRVNSEVIVQWINGNCDRPIITGAVHNERHMPPWARPTQQALTGLRSRELTPEGGNQAGGRSNHLILDDTAQRIQAQLKSDHQSSQLSLGHITRIENTRGRQDSRGEGWEITTNAWGAARAAKGLLVTTEARHNAKAHIKDMGETIQRLTAAREEQTALAELATQHGTQEGQQTGIANDIKQQNDAISGTNAAQAQTNTNTKDHFPELSQPHLILASAAGIAATSTESTHLASTLHTAITSGKSMSLTAGEGLFVSIRQTFRLFVHKAGMKLIAAAGDIDMQALTDSINLLAKLNITHTANKITITAKEDIVINGGGSYVKFSADGIEHGTKGTFIAHASTHGFIGPKNIRNDIPVSAVHEEGPHAVSLFALGAEGLVLQNADAHLFDRRQRAKITEQPVAEAGETSIINANHNQLYHSKAGYEGWDMRINVPHSEGDEDTFAFHSGELDENRDDELL